MSRPTLGDLARATIVAGLAGGAAMIPFGLLLRALGKDVNVYGALAAQLLLGSTSPIALIAVHVAVSVGLAAPAAFLAARRPGASWTIAFAWAFVAWLTLNVWLLPILFGRSSAWTGGWAALWPGFVIHAVYGLALGGALRWIAFPAWQPSLRAYE